jgi:aminotransferase
MADVGPLGFETDLEAARYLLQDIGVATVPGSSFYSEPKLGKDKLRFSFCKRLDTLRAVGERLAEVKIPAR